MRSDFNFISNGSMVTKPKPSPDIYHKALTRLCLDPQECIAIEDTAISMKAALTANIRCIAFPGEFVQKNDFNGALSVTKKLTPDILHPND
jgi:beta-phosphoglucomutase-like phosphatase (HAD superfamily)